jgi:hypothetical protein
MMSFNENYSLISSICVYGYGVEYLEDNDNGIKNEEKSVFLTSTFNYNEIKIKIDGSNIDILYHFLLNENGILTLINSNIIEK